MLFDLLDVCVVIYLDNILIFSESTAQHRKHMRTVFDRLAKHRLHVKTSKYELFCEELNFLGHVIGRRGVAVDQAKVAAVRDWPEPTDKRHIQMFLGLCNYYRRFIRNFGAIARPLTLLTGKVPFAWGVAQQQAFENLKSLPVSTPVLSLFHPNRLTHIECDASDFASGAVLEQFSDKDQGCHPVEFLSKQLTVAETCYSTTEREFVGLVTSLKQWRHLLVGRPFVVFTYHASRRYFQTQARLPKRQACWLELFGDFDFKIEHIAGATNHTNGLSHRPDLQFQTLATQLSDDTLEFVRTAQQQCTDDWFTCAKAEASSLSSTYVWHEGMLCKKWGASRTLLVPSSELQQSLIAAHHEPPLAGHLGAYRVIDSLSSRYY